MTRYYKRRKKPFKAFLAVFLMTVLLLTSFLHIDTRLRPLIQDYGIQAVRRGLMLAIHDGVQAVLSEQEAEYDDLVNIEHGADGSILAAHADVTAINLLKATVTSAVNKRLERYRDQTISIPMGSLIGGSFFIGRGPFLKVKINSHTSIVTTLSDSFTDAGINQTCHRICLNLKAYASVILPLERRSFELDTEFLICETVLVGDVPNTFANLSLF